MSSKFEALFSGLHCEKNTLKNSYFELVVNLQPTKKSTFYEIVMQKTF